AAAGARRGLALGPGIDAVDQERRRAAAGLGRAGLLPERRGAEAEERLAEARPGEVDGGAAGVVEELEARHGEARRRCRLAAAGATPFAHGGAQPRSTSTRAGRSPRWSAKTRVVGPAGSPSTWASGPSRRGAGVRSSRRRTSTWLERPRCSRVTRWVGVAIHRPESGRGRRRRSWPRSSSSWRSSALRT